MDRSETVTKVTLEEIIRRVRDIPTLPNITNEIMKLTEDPDSTVRDIENVIMKDQSLTARILRLANSAYYGYPRRISTISEASV
ncbi:MAG: HDOD domain-containing protein, partial [Clostridiales bacterium]|nr:HDOD domain-containing protein [Clostridiales bacterium]